jgi:hypothetical protein
MKIAIRLSPAKHGKVRYIDTSVCRVRVLEYDFDNPKNSPLFIDMYGGGIVLGSADMDDAMFVYSRNSAEVKVIRVQLILACIYLQYIR